MYKVFFNDREVFLTDDFVKNFRQREGLFYKFRDKRDLEEIIEFFSKLKRISSLYIFHYDLDVLIQEFKSCFQKIEAGGGVVKNENSEILLIYRRGFWDLPKGKLDEGENFRQAALREVKEECGIEHVEILAPLMSTYHTYQLKDFMVLKKTYWFEMLFTGKETPVPQEEEDIQEIKWCTASDIAKLQDNMHKSVLDVLKYNQILPL